MIKFLADECTFAPTVEFLRNEGWKVVTVKEVELQGAKDSEVLNKAREMGAVLITRDSDFGDIRRFPPSAHCGVVVLKMTSRTSGEVHAVLRKMLKEVKEGEFLGTLFIVEKTAQGMMEANRSASGNSPLLFGVGRERRDRQ